MICPLCGHQQPDYARECLQCHTPFATQSSDGASEHGAAEETDTIIRVERRRKARARGERTVNRDRVPIHRRHAEEPSGSSEPSEPSHQIKPPPKITPPPIKPTPVKQPPIIPPSVSGPSVSPPAPYRIPAASQSPPVSRFQEASRSSDNRSSDGPHQSPIRSVHSGGSPPVLDRTPSQSGGQLNQLVDRLKRVIVSTTPELQGRPVREYKGVVSTGAVVKLEGWAPYLEGVKDIGSLRHAPFDAQIRKARDVLITDLKIEAAKLGANGVVGLTVQLHPVQQGAADRLLWLVAIGTAVVLPEQLEK